MNLSNREVLLLCQEKHNKIYINETPLYLNYKFRGLFGEPHTDFLSDIEFFQGQSAVLDMMFGGESDTFGEVLTKRALRKNVAINQVLRGINTLTQQTMTTITDTKTGIQIGLNTEASTALKRVSSLLLELSRVKNAVILPESGEELNVLIAQLATVYITQEPIYLYTPFCPDWSRDAQGRYDFKSLGGGESFIANKFFSYAPTVLSIFSKYQVPYKGTLIFANWGLETEFDAKDTYGRKLSQEDVQMCFASTYAKTDEKLLQLQQSADSSGLFSSYSIISMVDFFAEQGIDPEAAYRTTHKFFSEDRKGIKLVDQLHTTSLRLNQQRLGLNSEENYQQTIQNLAEYATLGQAFGDYGIVIAAESHTSTKAYNLPRQNKLPVFYLKGERGVSEGVNIL